VLTKVLAALFLVPFKSHGPRAARCFRGRSRYLQHSAMDRTCQYTCMYISARPGGPHSRWAYVAPAGTCHREQIAGAKLARLYHDRPAGPSYVV
jgi:hypothetical protein